MFTPLLIAPAAKVLVSALSTTRSSVAVRSTVI
jgi:hypothetical protein